MVLDNKMSIEIDPQLVQRVLTSIEEINKELSFLLNLSVDERKCLPKMGDKSVSFVRKALEHARQNPQVVPLFLNIEEFDKDVKAVDSLIKILYPLHQLLEKVEDTTTIAGSESYASALVFYNAAKSAAKAGVPGMKTIVDDLSPRFPGRASTAVTAESKAK